MKPEIFNPKTVDGPTLTSLFGRYHQLPVRAVY